jgi:hypothetical protein
VEKLQCIEVDVMARKYESKWNIEHLTNAEIYAAIRYLEPPPKSNYEEDDTPVVLICVTVAILLLAYAGYLWLHS